jgi:Holliday junction resolvase RusA-like endonuclease
MIRIDFAHLKGDNHRLMPVRFGQRARQVTSTPYRNAKAACALLIRQQWGQPPLGGELSVVARFWFPDRKRRDPLNYAKLICDAMSGIVYVDDVQLADSRFIRVGYDKHNPRVELVIEMLDDGEPAKGRRAA